MRVLVPVLAAIVVSSGALPRAQGLPAQSPSGLSLRDAVELYARGEFDTAVTRLDTSRVLVRQFTRALDAWIVEGDPTAIARRTRIAAAFALDAGWRATRPGLNFLGTNFDPWFGEPRDLEKWGFASARAQPVLVEWVLEQLPAAVTDELDRSLTFAAIGFAQDGHAWYRLQDVLLPRARRMVGDHPRLRLANVIAGTNRDIGTLRYHSPPATIGKLRPEPSLVGPRGQIAAAIKQFEPLLAEASLAGEVELRIGYLELRRQQWLPALGRFEACRLKSTEPVWRATADYFAGWVHEQLGETDDAIVAYRRAHAIVPLMRNLTTRLSALLFIRGERQEAHELLDAALHARPAPTDLIFVFERADARFVPDQLAAIRKALEP